jgi:hypothetical protein
VHAAGGGAKDQVAWLQRIQLAGGAGDLALSDQTGRISGSAGLRLPGPLRRIAGEASAEGPVGNPSMMDSCSLKCLFPNKP